MTRFVSVGTCAACGSKGVVRHTGMRLVCLRCWREKFGPDGPDEQ